MDEIKKDKLKKEIEDILKDADLSKTSAKKVRKELEDRLGVDLTARRKEIDGLVMDYVDSREKDAESEEEEEEKEASDVVESEEEKPKKTAAKRASTGAKKPPPTKKKRRDASEESASAEDDNDDNYSPKKGATKAKKAKGGASAKKKKGGGGGGGGSDSEGGSDDDWKREPAAKKGAKGKGKGNSFTRAYTLSPELAELMGEDAMPRHAVVKKVWQIIKERNLYDPKNKQFAICDSDLQKVMGVKRFRTFGMLKYLRNHFLSD